LSENDEKLNEEIVQALRKHMRHHARDQSIYSRKDLGIDQKIEVYPARDADAWDIQRAIEKISIPKPNSSLDKLLSRGYYGYLKLRKILNKPKESFKAHPWLVNHLNACIDLVNPGGIVWVSDGDFNVSQALSVNKCNIALQLSAGARLINTGSFAGIQLGDVAHNNEITRSKIEGNGALVTRDVLGGTYGVHLINAHLCAVHDMKITNHAVAAVFSEGSWGSWISRVEVPTGAGATGLLLRKTLSGPFIGSLGDLLTAYQCWFQGTAQAIWIRDNPEKVLIDNCDIHDSAIGVLVDGARNLTIQDSYFEANTGYLIQLHGADAIVACTVIERNFLATDHNINIIYVENADGVEIKENNASPPTIGCTFVSTPADSVNRNILLHRNNLGIPAWVTEYSGNTESLIYHLSCYLPQFHKFPGMGTDFLPFYDAAFSLGSNSRRFANLYLWGNIKRMNTFECDVDPATDNTYALGNGALRWSRLNVMDILASTVWSDGVINIGGVYQKGGQQVVGQRQSAIADVSISGAAEDPDARTKINSILAALRAHGLIAT
jgi:hypothetical protein